MRVWVLAVLLGCGDNVSLPPEPPTGQPPLPEPPANTVGSFTIELPPATLQPGDETQPCFIFPLEVTGPSHIVGGAVLRTPPGLHHGNITTRPATGEGIRACTPEDAQNDSGTDVLAGGMVLFGSSTQISGDEWYRFPDGHGYRVRDGFEIVARMHYLNPTDNPLTVAPVYEWFTIDEATVTRELGAFLWLFSEFEIPANSPLTVTGDCDLPNNHPMHIVSLLPHMHKLGRSLDATYKGGPFDGEKFLDSPGYDPDNGVLVQYDPPVDLTPTTGITFSCSWQNTFDHTIVEGVGDNEMCMVFGYAWPVDKAYTAYATPGNCIMFPTPVPD